MTEEIKEPIEGIGMTEVVQEQAIQVHVAFWGHSCRSSTLMQIQIHLH